VTFLAPWLLAAAAAAAAGVVALHLLAWQRPRAAPLPTARFVPDRPARAASRSRRPQDLLLLALRVLLLLLVGAAFARPVLVPERRPVVRVIGVDVSRAVANVGDVRDSARAALRPGDALVLFDSAAHAVRGELDDTLAALRATRGRGSLSAALVAALREAASLAGRADSVELVLVSPLAEEEMDAATRELRSLWRGRVRLARVAPAPADSLPVTAAVRAAPDDPVRAAAGLAGLLRPDAPARIVRGALTSADTVWARGGARVLVHWPPVASAPAWRRRAAADTVGAVVAAAGAVVASFARPWRVPAGRAVAWWVDGEPAAAERPLSRGCVRDVAVPVPTVGDEALTPAFQRLVATLAEPCGGARQLAVVDDGVAAWMAGPGTLYVPPRTDRGTAGVPLVRWLFVAAFVVATAELLLRRRVRA